MRCCPRFGLATVLTVLITTQTGTRITFAIGSSFVPGELSYQRVDGVLLRDFTIYDAELTLELENSDPLTLSFERFNLRWRPWELLDQAATYPQYRLDQCRATVAK